MGMGVSGWRLAKAVSRLGHLGVVSGTALDTLFVRRLQDGDPGGHLRRALGYFPVPRMAEQALKTYFIPGGKSADQPYRECGPFTIRPPRFKLELCVLANFAEVFLAREGHEGRIGVNYLEKILLPNLPSIYGAMLAGVGYVIMGAGIPREIPAAMDLLAEHRPAALRVPVAGAGSREYWSEFSPEAVMGRKLPALRRPKFYPIVASTTLGMAMARRTRGSIEGLVIEGPLAGGHNAPPRGEPRFNRRGEPVYGPRDKVDLAVIKSLGLPFWLGGFYAAPDKLRLALERGASGIQVGTAFAFCEESGITEAIKRAVIQRAQAGAIDVYTDPRASPTGFPFKVVRLEGTLSGAADYAARPRVCDLGYLRTVWMKPDGSLGYRCPAEPVAAFVIKGGRPEDAVNRVCLCNALQGTVGVPQIRRNGPVEKPLVTSGDDLKNIARFLKPGRTSYTAQDVVEFLVGAPALTSPAAV
jgi:nitronate monooxygenase